MFVVNSRLGLFSATASCSGGKLLHTLRLPFSRSYGYNLPSSLTRVLPRTLGFSPCIPVSVYGTGDGSLARSFSRQCGSRSFGRIAAPFASRLMLTGNGFSYSPHFTLAHGLPFPCSRCLLCHSIALNDCRRFRNINRMSISYALRLGLGPDLP